MKDKISGFIYDKIKEEKDKVIEQWNSVSNIATKHFIIDDLLPKEYCKNIFRAFPRQAEGFHKRKSFREQKRTTADLSKFSSLLSEVLYSFQDKRIVRLISQITEINELDPDPKLYAGGLSMMLQGDFLNPHIDNSHDIDKKKFRRLNLLYYVTPNWVLKDGGNFELWSQDKKIQKTILSKFNRLIIMETTKTSWHSVSKVLSGRPRCCISNYYFSRNSPTQRDYFHVTSFSGRPEDKVKSFVGYFDNYFRNIFSNFFNFGRGKKLINKSKNEK